MTDVCNNFVLERCHFQQLIDCLTRRGYAIIGPTLRDGAIIYDSGKLGSDKKVRAN